jgi:excisionase family DNA binding protein
MREIMNKKEIADFLRISVSKLEGLMRKKEIPFYRINRRVIFYKEEILNWLVTHKVK